MQLFRILNSSFRTLRQSGNLSVYQWRRVYPCVQYCSSSVASTNICVENTLSSQAVIIKTRKQLGFNFYSIDDSDPNINEKRHVRASFICKQFKKLQSSCSDDRKSANGINIEQVWDLFKSINSDPSQLPLGCVAECVSAYVELSLAICANETEKTDCLSQKEYCMFETHLKNNLEYLPLYHRVQIYNTFFPCRLRHPQTVLFFACEKLLKEQVPMVTEPKEIVALCQVVNDSEQPELWNSIEKCIGEFVDSLSLTQVLSCLQTVINRASLDLNGVTNRKLQLQLCNKVLEHEMPPLQLYHLTVIASVMKKFSMADEVLLPKLCDRIMEILLDKGKQVSERQTEKISDLLNNVSRFQYGRRDIFDMLVDRLLKLDCNNRSLSVGISSKVLINAANLNISLSKGEQFIQEFLSTENNMKDQHTWIQLLWAFCVMGQENMEVVAEGIETLFKSTLQSSIEDDNKTKALMSMRKLRDIAVTKNIPLDSLPFLSKLQEMEQQRKSGPFEIVVCDAIEKSLPEGSYCKNVVTPAGHKIEIEVYVNGSGEAVVRNDQMTDLHRIAVKTRGYFTFSRPDRRPLGWVMMENRNLVKEGYTVLEIPYHEWDQLGIKVNKSTYILKKLQETVSSTLV
ncbi:uncharacterized protein LOC117321875 [Pecten maximus]|uniref:uncharacterized protein LOC117321875 n=1 Tax=Pecten maximus TaxID=6579 RepID=UPI0014583BE0|nr:uncharacterized protein LOC117321875 [Pecten maximus]XP_033732373.1 uncharacterized protein LOC117321875 [Pecten maximus]XP_033732374.1 uncharacterized protein LOC117321875 [Pecten maximus]